MVVVESVAVAVMVALTAESVARTAETVAAPSLVLNLVAVASGGMQWQM